MDIRDEEQGAFKTVTVDRRLHEAAQDLERLAAGSDWSDIHLAEWNRDRCRDEGDEEGRAFWGAVWTHMMTMACCATGQTAIEVVGDGGERPVPAMPEDFRRRTRRRRNGRAL
jgi:hypothetical protein